MPSERRRARPRFGVSPSSAWTRYGAAPSLPADYLSIPDVGRLVSQRTGLPVVFAPSASQLEELVSQRPPAVILYVNHREPNFRLLRHAHIPHVYIGHGESDKGASASHQNLAYDYAFVAGQAGRDGRCPSSMSAYERPWLGDRWPVPGVAGSIRPESCMRRPGKVGFPPWLWARSSRTECL